MALAAIFAVAVLATSFPLSSLLAQHRALSAADAQLAAVRNEDRSLAQQQQDLNSKSAVDRLARQDYQMVLPGQTLYDVLPPSGQSTAAAGTSADGDPGTQPLVSPDHAPDLSPEPGLTPTTVPASTGSPTPTGATSVTGASGGSTPASGFWSRVSSTLEFWK